MRDLTLSIPTGVSRRKTKSASSAYKLNLAILASTVLIGFCYLFVVNSLGTKGYEIKKLDTQLRELELIQKDLQMRVSDLQSISRIQETAQKLNFTQPANITYLKDSDFALK